MKIPILSPVEKSYEKGQITALLKSCYFIGNETRTQLFEDTDNEEKVMGESCQEPDLLYDLPKIPAVRNVNSSTSGLPSVPEGHIDTASNCEYEPESRVTTECSNLAANEFCPSLSQAVARSFSQEILEFEENSKEVFSFLAERKLLDEYSAEQNISKLI